MREQLKMRIDEVIACVNRRIAAGQSVHEALAELRRLAGVAYCDGFDEGFGAGRDGAIRPSSRGEAALGSVTVTASRCRAMNSDGDRCYLDVGHKAPHQFVWIDPPKGLASFEAQRWHCPRCNTHIGCTEGTAERAIREHANVCVGVLERLS